MGCDIHLFTERKRKINKQEIWVNIDNHKLDPYSNEYELKSPYNDRNYTLFSILANVRNGDGNNFISKPKGLPNDLSDVVKIQSNYWDGDGHSHSFLTMKEIYDFYELNKIVKYTGLVDKKGAEEIEKGNMPNWWCKWSSCNELIYKEWDFENNVLKNFIDKLERHFESEYYDKESESELFRIVFWFDN